MKIDEIECGHLFFLQTMSQHELRVNNMLLNKIAFFLNERLKKIVHESYFLLKLIKETK